MTDQDTHPQTGIGHPAPGRNHVGDLLLIFSFLLVPIVWAIQLAAISSLAGMACLDQSRASVALTSLTWAGPAIRWINISALILGAIGIGLSLLNMRRSHEAAEPPPGGPISAGEGRVHWMAFGGFFVALVSMISIIANSIPMFWGALCPI
ncbi:hypothetical protein U5922_018105 [Aquicoccus sp. G2-2]|uniref:hypothetical protein n=1 Tax=Aquicoccus sp. G2-2 TaxID=3092120 RepID=UPI002AE02810|nr:hypothetical protein [Aquicoccus sp. G2-2]MEA1115286.1 hypothetical protein [Aquicoccus sp. G2-2]